MILPQYYVFQAHKGTNCPYIIESVAKWVLFCIRDLLQTHAKNSKRETKTIQIYTRKKK